jgi:hypothetical protein
MFYMSDDSVTTNKDEDNNIPDAPTRTILSSRKFVYGSIGICHVSFIYFVTIYLVTRHPEASSAYIALFNVMTGFISAVIGGLIGLHHFLDVTMSSNSTLSNTSNLTKTIQETISTALSTNNTNSTTK